VRNVVLIHAPLLEGVPAPVDVVCANLPYIPSAQMASLPVSVREFEPWSALDGGPDGLDAYQALLQDLPQKLAPQGVALMECDPGQTEALLGLALATLPGADGRIVRDLAGDARVVEVRR
jgi:release factor glutamine methyltransferase